jgi:hypothetical protein
MDENLKAEHNKPYEPELDDLHSEIHEFDFDRAAKLIGIIQSVAAVVPSHVGLSGIAGTELAEMNAQATEIQKRIAARHHEAREKARQRAHDLAVERQAEVDRRAKEIHAETVSTAAREAADREVPPVPRVDPLLPGQPVNPLPDMDPEDTAVHEGEVEDGVITEGGDLENEADPAIGRRR